MAQILEKLKKHNFWTKKIQAMDFGLIRKEYIDFFAKSLGLNLIKVITGQRRTGKSFLLKQFIQYLIVDKKVAPTNILYINFELADFLEIKNEGKFHEIIEFFINNICTNKKNTIYLCFDEIQEIENWERIINSWLADDRIKKEIFITGSNSKLLSSELATYLTGRYITKEIFPFGFNDCSKFLNYEKTQVNLEKYLQNSSLPEALKITDDELLRIYIKDTVNSILFNDIVRRYKVNNADLLEKVFLFLVNNIANPFSINSIVSTLKTLKIETNTTTLANYIRYLEEAFLIYGVDRYDIQGKRILEGEKKYYINDLGFRNFLFSNFESSPGKLLENYIFNALQRNGFKIYVGKIANLEIDFIAEKNDQKLYIQSTLEITEKNIEREYGNLEKIKDNWRKLVVSLDSWKHKPKDGIENIKAWQFEDWLTLNQLR